MNDGVMTMKRRSFMVTALGTAMSIQTFARNVFIGGKDVSYEPDQPLESTGLSIEDGLKILKKGEQGNVAPVLREEILDNPDAVFFIYADVQDRHNWDGRWNDCTDQFERLGKRVSDLIFRKGSSAGGRTFVKPNMVGSGLMSNPPVFNSGGVVHPYFTVGLVDGLRGIGNTNVAIAARGAMRHKHFVESGLMDLFNSHNLPLIEAHVQYFKDYKKSELRWFDNPNGIVQRRICAYRPVYDEGTTFINIAHAHVHKVGYTTLTIKNIMGTLPRGYGHTCDSWTHLDVWRKDLMDDFNRDFRVAIEQSYVKHARMGYKYWDEGGFYQAYLSGGGYPAYRKNPDIADSRLFWAELWAQRMMDTIEVLPKPYVNIVDGVFVRGDDSSGYNNIRHGNFITVGRSMVAVDAVTSWLMGHDPREIPYLRIASERGLGENDIEKIPIFMLSEKGVERLRDYRLLKRTPAGIYIYGVEDNGPRFL